MRPILLLSLFICSLGFAEAAEVSHDWGVAVSRLHAGDHLSITLASGAANGVFQRADDKAIVTDGASYRREDVLTIERTHGGPGSRAKHAMWGALIGGGAGGGSGAAANACSLKPLTLCLGRGVTSGIGAGIGIAGGAALGALLPAHAKRELIYSAHDALPPGKQSGPTAAKLLGKTPDSDQRLFALIDSP